MSYHVFNNLDELINGYRAAKIGQGILYCDLMDVYVTVLFRLRLTANASTKVNYGKNVEYMK